MGWTVICAVRKYGHGCHLLVHGSMWHTVEGCWLEGYCFSLQMAAVLRLLKKIKK